MCRRGCPACTSTLPSRSTSSVGDAPNNHFDARCTCHICKGQDKSNQTAPSSRLRSTRHPHAAHLASLRARPGGPPRPCSTPQECMHDRTADPVRRWPSPPRGWCCRMPARAPCTHFLTGAQPAAVAAFPRRGGQLPVSGCVASGLGPCWVGGNDVHVVVG